jgi:protein-S-isoprenylcysteine O-methyltransferase Ste14
MKRLMERPQLASTASAAFGVGLLEPATAPARVQPRRTFDIADIAARVLIGALFTLMAVRIGSDFLQTGRLTGLLLLASETLVVVLTVFRRPSAAIDRSLKARLLTIAATMGPPLVRPAAVTALLPELVTVSVSAVGLFAVIAGKLSLGRSFGLMPANRGVVSTGMYRLVRHPIYLGYLVTHVAFLAANPTAANFTLLVAADVALMMRAVCEERTLARDSAYREYQHRVRWRVLPGVF